MRKVSGAAPRINAFSPLRHRLHFTERVTAASSSHPSTVYLRGSDDSELRVRGLSLDDQEVLLRAVQAGAVTIEIHLSPVVLAVESSGRDPDPLTPRVLRPWTSVIAGDSPEVESSDFGGIGRTADDEPLGPGRTGDDVRASDDEAPGHGRTGDTGGVQVCKDDLDLPGCGRTGEGWWSR